MGCCKKILDLGTVGIGNVLRLGIKAQMAGSYTAKLQFLQDEFISLIPAQMNDDLTIVTDRLNEDYTYLGELFEPGDGEGVLGNKVIIAKDGEEYDCFQFKTFLSNVIPS